MKRPLPLKIAKALLRLANGEMLPASSARHLFVSLLIDEGILLSTGKHRKTLRITNKNALALIIENQLQISDLEMYVDILEKQDIKRFDLIKTTKDSKTLQIRTFKGFLINSFSPIPALLNGKSIIIKPEKGSFVFVSDFETFLPSPDITIVGVENAENFNYIESQRHLFENISPLFISRYPQNQNKDVIKWLKNIPNNYLHFGDFDIAGIGIYLNEYKRHIGERSRFFIPKGINKALKENGNRVRYDLQKINFAPDTIQEEVLKDLFQLIQKEKKGLDQEFFIKI